MNLITRSISCHRYLSDEMEGGEVDPSVKRYTIRGTVSPENTGTVTGGGRFQENSTLKLTAIANDGYSFSKWSDDNTSNPRTIIVTEDKTYTAIFVVDTDTFQYDVKMGMPASGEVDFLYTADIHVGWKNFGSSRFGESSKIFSLDIDQTTGESIIGGDVKAYQNKLEAANIPTYLLDCGDWSKSSVYTTGSEDECVNHALSIMQGMDYFGITTGNWEFYWDPMSKAINYLNRMSAYGLMACNVNNSNGVPLYPGGINPEFPGCKTLKIGDKKIAVIAVGYPSPNGYKTYGEYDEEVGGTGVEYNSSTYRWNYKQNSSTLYRWFDSSNNASAQQNRTVSHTASGSLYGRLQNYIDKLKGTYGFDYIIVFSHMDRYANEDYEGEGGSPDSDNRFYSRADFTIMNTSGINVLIPGHLNAPVKNTYTFTWKNGQGSGIVAPEAGATMNSFGRLRINLNNDTITCKLLTSLNDLTI